MKENEIINKGEIYTISLYHGRNNYESFLEVVSNNFENGDLTASGNKNSILRIELELAYGHLDYFKWDFKYWLWRLKHLDKEFNKKIFKYEINNLNKIKSEINKYKKIRLWVDQNDSNSYMFYLFFCYEFYDLIKDKEIIVVNLDNFYKTDKRIIDLVNNNQIEENKISLIDIEKNKSEWQKQLEINSEIRDVRNGVIKNLSDQDLYKPVLKVIKRLGRVNRMEAIHKLQESDILNNGHPIIYNYIIRCLIDKNSLNEYKVKFKPKTDIDYYVAEDEYRNNEIEYADWRYCLVGNIVDRRVYGEDHEIKYGTKNFSPGTKVYVSYTQWGDGGEQKVVIGLPRNGKKLIECIIRREYICNFRLKKIYPSAVLDKIDNSEYLWWGNDEKTKEWILDSAEWLNEHAQEEKKGLKNENENEFIENVDKLDIEDELFERITNVFKMKTQNDLIKFCKNIIKDKSCNIISDGKNWCCKLEQIKILVNASNYKIVSVKFVK